MQVASKNPTVDLDSDLHPESRIWIYQSVPSIPPDKRDEIEHALHSFAKQWASHSKALTAEGHILFDRFILLIADETRQKASGCSIDDSVHFLKSLQQHYNIDLFNRMQFSYIDREGNIQTKPAEDFSKAYDEGLIHDDTPVFDQTIQRKKELDKEWIKPLQESYHARFV